MKKGFTLVELLAVIVILGIVTAIAVPVIGGSIATSREKAYNEQVKIIEEAARSYMASHSTELPDVCKAISVKTLKNAGLLQNKDIKNPKGSGNLNGNVIITFEANKYKYTYSNDGGTC